MKISKSYSCKYWNYLCKQLEEDFDNPKLWEKAYELFKDRIDSRYLDLIHMIEKRDNYKGEGFLIMTIYCSLIEFLETIYQGRVFKDRKKNELTKYEYGHGESKSIYVSFLTRNKIFNFSKELAIEFYKNVRCRLLHEAQTGINWKIRVDNDKLITEDNGNYILNRIKFQQKIEYYFKDYKKNLFNNPELKKAFIRKFNGICYG